MNQRVLKHFKSADPILHQQMSRYGVASLEIAPNLFLRLCRSVVGQQLSVKAAASIFERFQNLFPKKNITVDSLITLSHECIRSCGMSNVKAKSLRDIATRINEGSLDLNKLYNKSEEDAMAELMAIYGVGEWTAQMFLMFALGREDIFSFKDAGLMRAMRLLYGLEQTSDISQYEDIIAKWSPYKTYACRTLWNTLDNEPK